MKRSVTAVDFERSDALQPRLVVVDSPPSIDLGGAERAVTDLLVALGHDPTDEHLADTPRRGAKAGICACPIEACAPRVRARSPRRSTACSATTPGPARSSSPSPAQGTEGPPSALGEQVQQLQLDPLGRIGEHRPDGVVEGREL